MVLHGHFLQLSGPSFVVQHRSFDICSVLFEKCPEVRDLRVVGAFKSLLYVECDVADSSSLRAIGRINVSQFELESGNVYTLGRRSDRTFHGANPTKEQIVHKKVMEG